MKAWLIKLLGGYPTISEAIEAIESREDKHLILTKAVKELFNTISADDVLKEEKGIWIFMGKQLPDETKKQLIADSVNFINSKLWKVLKADVQYQANKKMYILSQTDLDMIMGKSWTYVFDCLSTRLKSMQKGFGKYNTG